MRGSSQEHEVNGRKMLKEFKVLIIDFYFINNRPTLDSFFLLGFLSLPPEKSGEPLRYSRPFPSLKVDHMYIRPYFEGLDKCIPLRRYGGQN